MAISFVQATRRWPQRRIDGDRRLHHRPRGIRERLSDPTPARSPTSPAPDPPSGPAPPSPRYWGIP